LARAYVQQQSRPSDCGIEEAIAARPDYVEALLLLAELNTRTGNYQDVVAAMADLVSA
jgi:hypothetical protein